MENQLKRNLFFNTVGSLVFYICQSAITILVLALAGPVANGLLATAMTISNVVISAAGFGMRTFQVSDLNSHYNDRTYLTSRYVTMLVAFVGCCIFAFVNSYSSQQRWIILLYTAYRLIESWSDVWHGYLQKAERMDIVGISFGIRGILTLVVLVVGLLLTDHLALILAVLFLSNSIYVLCVDIPLAAKQADFSSNGGKSLWRLLAECAPLAVCAFLNTAVPSIPRYYCERILGSTQMGYFASIFLPVAVLQVAMIYLFVPFITTFARMWIERNRLGYYKGIGFLFVGLGVLWVCGAVGVALLGRWGLSFLYPSTPELLEYTSLLQPLVVATVCMVLSSVLIHLLTIARAMQTLIFSSLAGCLAAWAGSSALLHQFGLYGAAYATILGIGVQAVWALVGLLMKSRLWFAQKEKESS